MCINECSQPPSKSSWDSQDFGDVSMVWKWPRPQWVSMSVNEATYGIVYIDGLVQERRNSSVLAMELCLSRTYPSICLLTDRANEGNNVIITKLNNKTMYIYSMVHTVRMMSWCHRNAFHVTVPLWGESTVHRLIPGNAGFIFFYDASLNKRLNKPWGCRWFEFETIWRLSLWRQFNDPI